MRQRRRRRTAAWRLASEALERRAMLSGTVGDFESRVARISWQGQDVEVMRDEWLVRMPQLNAATARNVVDYQSAVPGMPQGWSLRDVGLGMYGITAPSTAFDAVSQWAATQGTLWVQPNFVYRRQAVTPNEGATNPPANPGFESLWGLHNTGQTGVLNTSSNRSQTGPGTVDADIDAPEAWQITTGSNNIIVAVLDDGVDYTHPDLQPNMWTRPANVPASDYGLHGWDSGNNDGDIKPIVTVDPFTGQESGKHGTHVAGTIGAKGDNGRGITGVAWDVRLYGAKAAADRARGFTTLDLIDATRRVVTLKTEHQQNVVAINASLGGYRTDQAWSNIISAANDAGILFVASAGNGLDPVREDGVGDNNDVLPAYPASYPLPNIISVAASNRQDRLTRFSNYGTASVDIAAPGSGVWSAVPGGEFEEWPGTSMAAPHVAGVAALVASAYLADFGTLPSVDVLKSAILDGADRPATLTYTESASNRDPFPGTVHRIAENRRLNAFGALRKALGYVDVSIGNVTIVEGDDGSSFAQVTVSLSAASPQTVTVDYATKDGSARAAGDDYVEASGTLTFAPGETSKTIQIEIIGDLSPESDEAFTVELSNVAKGFLTTTVGTVTIDDDDTPPALLVKDVEVEEGNEGTTTVVVTVSLATAFRKTITVGYATADDSAEAETGDYVATTGTLTFAPGELEKTIEIDVVGDLRIERDETFLVQFANLAEGIVSTAGATVTIVNDDFPPVIGVEDVEVAEGDGGTTVANFRVTLNVALRYDVSIRYMTLDRTARSRDRDYRTGTGTAIIPAGALSTIVPVTVTGDTKFEADETFVLRLVSASGVPIARPMATCTIINDDVEGLAVVSVGDVRQTEGHSAQKMFSFLVSLAEPVTVPVTVEYLTVDGTALAGRDYMGTSGSLTFMPGMTRRSVTVWVPGDTVAEPTRQFGLAIRPAPGVTLKKQAGIGTILDDDKGGATTRRATAAAFAMLAAEQSRVRPITRRR